MIIFFLTRLIMKNGSNGSSEVCFGDSNSSVGSVSGGSNGNNNNNNHNSHGHCGSGGVDGCGGMAACAGKSGGGSSSSEHPSIVERNARIIKWLWNCRRAHLQQTPSST